MSKTDKQQFVLDCSVTMAWCFEDEITPYSEKIFDLLEKYNAVVPSLWSMEVANVLLMAQRKKRISKIQAQAFKDSLNLLPIQIDHSTAQRAMGTIMEIADEFTITVYDATYLELAIQNRIPIATLDKTLASAAKKLKVGLFEA